MAKKTLKAKDIERLENTSGLPGAPGTALTTATTFCCPPDPNYGICHTLGPISFKPPPDVSLNTCLTTATTFCCPTGGSICNVS